MTKKIKDDKDIDFTELKFLAFMKGSTELAEMLNQGEPVYRKWFNGQDETPHEIKMTLPKDKALKVRQQANEFGYKVSIWNWYKNNDRQVIIGRYY